MRNIVRALVVATTLGLFAVLLAGCSQPPQAVADSYTVLSGKTLKVPPFQGLLANDSDPEGDALTVELDRPVNYGTLDLKADGSFTYVPRFTAGADSFSYRAFDGFSRSATVEVRIRVDATPVAGNDSWVVVPPGPLTVAAPGLLGNDLDPAGDVIRPHIVAQPAHGTLKSFPDGSFSYKPAAGFLGKDIFKYVATDGGLASPVAVVSLYVTTTNRAPVGLPEGYTLEENGAMEISAPGVLANDSDPDGHPLRAELVQEPGAVDTFELRPDGGFTLALTANWDSDISFRYRVTDGAGASAPITVTIDVIAVNNPPVGEDDDYETPMNETLFVSAPGVLANDYDPVEFDGVRVDGVVAGPGHGTLDLHADGSFTYTPSTGFTGVDGFTYRPADSTPGNVTNVNITVTDVG